MVEYFQFFTAIPDTSCRSCIGVPHKVKKKFLQFQFAEVLVLTDADFFRYFLGIYPDDHIAFLFCYVNMVDNWD